MADEDYAAALARVSEYRAQLARADGEADRGSLARAADLQYLYDQMRWVDELPPPLHKVWRGRPVDPQSWNRFAKWVLQVTGLGERYTAYLHRAHDTVRIIGTVVQINRDEVGERALRPLARLRTAGYGDRIPEVYKNAVALAEGRPVTSADTRQAVNDYLAARSPSQRRDASRAETAKRHRYKAQTAVEILIGDNDAAQIEQFAKWIYSRLP